MTPQEEQAYYKAQIDKDRWNQPDPMGATTVQGQQTPEYNDAHPFEKAQQDTQFDRVASPPTDVSRDPSSVKQPLPQLKYPIKGPPEASYQNENIQNPPMDLQGNLSTQQPSAPASTPQQPDQSSKYNNANADMMVGASHALLALLSGNANRSVLEYGKANQYEASQKAADVAANQAHQLVMTTDEQGNPVYTPAQQAAGENPYIKPLRPMAGMIPKQVSVVDPKNPGVITKAVWNPATSKFTNMDTGEVIVGAQEASPVNMQEGMTAGGSKVATPFNRLTGAPTGPQSTITTGEADQVGQGTKKYEQGMKISEDVQKQRLPLQAKKADINTSMGLLNSGASTTQLIGVGNTLKNLAQQGLSSQSSQMYAPPGLFQRAQDAAQTLISGNVGPDKINEAKQVLIEINKSLDEEDKALTSGASKAFAGSSSSAKSYIAPYIAPSAKTPIAQPKAPSTPLVKAADANDAGSAIKWANANSSDPRAKEIFRRFGR